MFRELRCCDLAAFAEDDLDAAEADPLALARDGATLEVLTTSQKLAHRIVSAAESRRVDAVVNDAEAVAGDAAASKPPAAAKPTPITATATSSAR